MALGAQQSLRCDPYSRDPCCLEPDLGMQLNVLHQLEGHPPLEGGMRWLVYHSLIDLEAWALAQHPTRTVLYSPHHRYSQLCRGGSCTRSYRKGSA